MLNNVLKITRTEQVPVIAIMCNPRQEEPTDFYWPLSDNIMVVVDRENVKTKISYNNNLNDARNFCLKNSVPRRTVSKIASDTMIELY